MRRSFWIACWFTLTLATLPAVRAQDAKPLGAWFGDYQKLIFDDEFVWGSDAYVVTHYANSNYPPFSVKDLEKYSGVLIGPAAGRALSPAERASLQRWVRQGGRLIVSLSEVQKIFGDAPPEVGDQPRTRRQGGGTVTYLGSATMPQKRPAVKEKTVVRDMTPQAVQAVQNLMSELNIPRRHEVIARWARTAVRETDAAMVFWWRYKQETPLGGGIKGGTVHGATDELGFHAVKDPHYVTDLHATVLRQLGLDPRELELPGRKRLEVDFGHPIQAIIS